MSSSAQQEPREDTWFSTDLYRERGTAGSWKQGTNWIIFGGSKTDVVWEWSEFSWAAGNYEHLSVTRASVPFFPAALCLACSPLLLISEDIMPAVSPVQLGSQGAPIETQSSRALIARTDTERTPAYRSSAVSEDNKPPMAHV